MEERATPPAAPGTYRFAAGTVLSGRYRVIRALARGGMGEVYEVQDEQLHEVVALKTLDERLASDALAIGRFQSEVKIARRISHPNVCRTFDFGLHRDDAQREVHFLTMELLSGEGLDARLARGALGPDELIDVMAQVAAAIEAAHEVGVVHRDLKPSNVMLVKHSGGGLRAVVSDFGIARNLHDATTTREGWVGTPAYVAPEQLEGKGVGPAADVFAFGVMFFEAATGRLPFEGATTVEVALQRLARPAPRLTEVLPTLPQKWSDLVERCLARDASARPGFGAVRSALLGASTLRRRSRSRGLAAALSGVLLAAGGALWWRSGALPADVAVRTEVKHAFAGEREWLARATKRILERELERDRRFRVVTDVQTPANTVLTLEVSELDGGVRLAAMARREGGRARSGHLVEAASINAGLAQLLPGLRDELGRSAPQPPWTEAELSSAKALGAASVPGVALYTRFTECIISTIEYERAPCERLSRELVALEPAWPRAWMTQGLLFPWSDAEKAKVRALVANSSDTLGLTVLRGQMGETVRMDPLVFQGEDPLLANTAANLGLVGLSETEGVYYRGWVHSPHLQFGTSLFNYWRDTERRQELLRKWKVAAPESVQRIITQRSLSELDDATLLYGELPLLTLTRAREHLRLFDFGAARVRVLPLLQSTDPVMRVAGMRLSAEVAIYEGRFADAVVLAERVVESQAPAMESQFSNNFELYRQLHAGLGDAARAREANERYLKYLRGQPFGAWATIALLDYLLDSAQCPDLEPRLAATRGQPDEGQAYSLLIRVAQVRGCKTCADVLAAGMHSLEFFDSALYDFAVCARQRGEYELALKSLDSISFPGTEVERWGPSPFHTVLAFFERARVLEAAGRPAEALVAWRNALRFWKTSDRPRPEVKEARDAIARLEGGSGG